MFNVCIVVFSVMIPCNIIEGYSVLEGRRDSVVSIATGYRLDDGGV
jgi:hypothetical protein